MDVFKVEGGTPLQGEIFVSGAKNAALPIFAATLLTEEPCVITNVPDLSDIRYMAEILRYMGASVERLNPTTYRVQAKEIGYRAPYELVRKMRASICLLGPLTARKRRAEISLPGGCVIGPRPIDLHLKGLSRLNCAIEIERGYINLDASRMEGADIFLGGRQGSTVTGTANLVMAATLCPGVTRIESAACEPEVVDLCNMLITMGARIRGIGSHHLEITGVERLYGCTHPVIPDRIEAGTYLAAAAVTRGKLTVRGAQARDLRALLDKLEEARIPTAVDRNGDITVDGSAPEKRKPVEIITLPHPGFPTDLQAQMCTLMALTPGLSMITERIYPNRFMHVSELQRMGAEIAIEGPSAIIQGRLRLSGAPVMASDLRASAALVLAGLAAEGETWVQRIYHLDRGYEKMERKLAACGARITRLKQEEMPKGLTADEG